MPLEQLLLLCLYTAALTGTPGPANMAFLACGSNFGVRRTIPFLFGTLAGFMMTYCLAVAGLLAVVTGMPLVWTALRIACLGYILYLAWMIASARPKVPHADTPSSRAPGFWRGYWVHPLNPKAYAMQIAAISQFVSPERYLLDATIVAASFLLLGGALNSCWVIGGRLLAALTRAPTLFRAVNVTLAVLMVASTIASLRMT